MNFLDYIKLIITLAPEHLSNFLLTQKPKNHETNTISVVKNIQYI